MKLKLTALFTLVCTVLATTVANATHIFGADLLYKHISGNTYQIILTLYGDCSADATLFGQLSTATPNVLVYRGATLFTDTLKLRSINGGIEVSPVCPSRIRDTKCSGGLLPGIKQFTYIDTIDLRGTHTGWRFVFNGKLGGTYQAGRSGNITNAYSGTVMQIEATLNNTNGPNNSPVYSTIPTPFYCLNLLQEYNQGATDPDADSLAFSLVPGVDASSSGAPVNYVFPYTAAAPLSTAAGTFRFSDINGQLTFNPDIVQDALVVNKVYEYERGVLVGTSEREMTFIVLDNCGGNPPSSQLNHVVGATVTDGNIINICKGAPFVSFDIDIINPDSDYVKLGYSGLPGASRLNIFNDSTAHPYASFAWNTDTLTTGNYTFFLKIKNNHCPLISNQTVAYTIKVSNKPTINTEQLSPTECVHRSYIKFNLAEGYKPRTVSIYKDGTLVNRITDTADAVFDSLAAGDYTAIVSSDSLCSSTTVFAVADSGRLPLSGFNKTVCKNDTPIQLYVPLLAAGAVIQWYDIAGTPLSTAPTVPTGNTGTYRWYFIQTYKGCNSGPVFVSATVKDLPTTTILNIPDTVCYGDDVLLEATGGVTYAWLPEGAIREDRGVRYATLIQPTTLVVIATDSFGCKDTASVTYNNIEQCCSFAFPNAFTPNNDHINDEFRMVTYGNMRHYSLSIYNRYGQRVYWTGDPKRGWDGTYGGAQCDAGVYYYYLDAECLTGPKQTQKGDITLIR